MPRPQQQPVEIDPESMSTEALLASYWEAGNLEPIMHAGQRKLRRQLIDWYALDVEDAEPVPGSMPRVFCLAKAGRWGGTTIIMWWLYELGVRFALSGQKRPMELRFTSAFQKTIEEIIGKVTPQCFETAPESCKPTYYGKRGPKPAGLYWPKYGPTNGMSVALAGLDANPDATRGQASDGDVVSEAAFVQKLDYTLRSVLYRQYQGRPWARAIVESSAPRDMNTDWELIYTPDCKRRNAYFSATIEDNPLLTRREKDHFINAAGGRGHPDCEREYFNAILGDPVLQVLPEYKEEKHKRAHELPKHAICITAADPGQTHQFGLVFGYYDFDAACGVIQDSWAQSNASTRKVAAIVAAREFDLWGTWPPYEMHTIPLWSEGLHEGWKDLLRGDRCEHLAEALHAMACMPREVRPHYESRPGRWITTPQPEAFTYFDNDHVVGFHTNPHTRVSDTDVTFIQDVSKEFGLGFEAANKAAPLEVRVNVTRNWLSSARLTFEPDAGPVLDHVKAGKWNKQRTKFEEHPIYGHFDVLAALVYWAPACDMIRHRRPHPPVGLASLTAAPGHDVQHRLPWSPISKAEEALEAIKKRWLGYGPERGRMKSYR